MRVQPLILASKNKKFFNSGMQFVCLNFQIFKFLIYFFGVYIFNVLHVVKNGGMLIFGKMISSIYNIFFSLHTYMDGCIVTAF